MTLMMVGKKTLLAIVGAVLFMAWSTSAWSMGSRRGTLSPTLFLSTTSDADNHDSFQGENDKSPVVSVNYFISRKCNYSCQFCFHTQKNTDHLALETARAGLEMLREAGTEKINFAGGEPFLNPTLLGELCKVAHHLGMAVSIVSNGSMITSRWMEQYGTYVDVLAVSCDSFVPETNAAIGRGGDANNNHVQRVLRVRELCTKYSIKFKMNTVVCQLNWQEDMSPYVRLLNPERWKVFQCLILEGENAGGPEDLRDARALRISTSQFQSFVGRHVDEFVHTMVPEPNDMMQNSYLPLDEDMCFLDCSGGGKVPSESILKVGVFPALEQAGFDMDMFHQRGGIFDWKRDRNSMNKDIQGDDDGFIVDPSSHWNRTVTMPVA